MDLLVVIIASLVLVPLAVFWGGSPVSLVLGLIFALFSPGYTLVAALFTKRDDLDRVQRLALSFGLSIALVPLIGLVLNYTPWGVSLYPMLMALLLLIIAASGIAWYRRRRLPPEERFEFRFRLRLAEYRGRQKRWDRALLGLLVVAIIGAVGMLVYMVQSPGIEEEFTEFYMLNSEGKAENYPRTLTLGEEARVTLGIVNHEQEATEYMVRIIVAGQKVEEVAPIAISDGEKWEQVVSFAPAEVGENQLVEFLLYKEGRGSVYQALRLWIDVVEGP